MALRTVAAALACCALIPASAAASKPNFPKTVSGTASGSFAAKKDGMTYKSSWDVNGLRFKLVHVRFVENTWTGFYSVTGGTVNFSESQSGACTYSVNETFALKGNLPSRRVTTPFSMTRSMLGRDTYSADMRPTKRWNATRTCSYEGSEPTTDTVKVTVGNLLDTGSKSFKIGRTMKGSYKIFDDYLNRTTVWTWSLRPGR